MLFRSAAAVVTPSASSEFPKPGDSTTGSSLGRGLVNAGLTGSIPARRVSDAASTPPQLPAIIPHSPIDAPAAQPPDVASSSLSAASPQTTPDERAPSPSLISFGTSSVAGSSIRATPTRGDSDDEEPPITPSQGYQPLEDDDDDSDSGPKGLGADERREEVAVPSRMTTQTFVDAEG